MTLMEDEQYMMGCCRPTMLKFTLSFSLCSFFVSLQAPILTTQVTSIERQFELNSTQLGGLLSANDIGFLIVVLVITHLAKDLHTPRMLALSTVIFGLAAMGVAAVSFTRLPLSQNPKNENITSNTTDRLQDKYVCLPNMTDRSFMEGCTLDSGRHSDNVAFVVLIGCFLGLQGSSKALRSPLGLTYIDNNVHDRSKTGFYVGLVITLLVFGPPTGFALSGFLTEIPVDLSDTALTSKDPRWISAWWIGFAVYGLLAILSAIPMAFFPRSMPAPQKEGKKQQVVALKYTKQESTKPHDEETETDRRISTISTSVTESSFITSSESSIRKTNDVDATDTSGLDVYNNRQHGQPAYQHVAQEAGASSGELTAHDQPATPMESTETSIKTDNETPNKTFVTKLKELPLALYRIVKNPLLVTMLFAFGSYVFGLVGYASFIVKFALYQFGLPQNTSSFVFGLSILVFAGAGTFVGGMLWNTTDDVSWWLQSQKPILATIAIGLSSLAFGGAGTFIGGMLVYRRRLTRRGCLRWALFAYSVGTCLTTININMGCPNPHITGYDDKNTSVLKGTTCECDNSQTLPVCDGNQTFLSPCHAGCFVAVNETHFSNCGRASKGQVETGICGPKCNFLIPFVVLQVLSALFFSTTVTPMYYTVLRSVPTSDKTLGLGVLAFSLAVIGFIPGPVVFGSVIDTACLIWSTKCGKKGACSLYNVTDLRLRFVGLDAACQFTTTLLLALALFLLTWQVRTGRDTDDRPGEGEGHVEGGEGGKSRQSFKVLDVMAA